MIIPSIDLMNGKVVQLEQGKKKKMEFEDVDLIADRFKNFNEVQVVDLDAAIGNGSNEKIVSEVCRKARARVGGGVRSAERAAELAEQGAYKVIIGSKANKQFLKQLCSVIGRERIIVAADSFRGNVVVEGWRKKTGKSPFQLIGELEKYCSEFFFTFVEREGRMNGIDFTIAKKLRKATNNRVVVAGGIASIEEAERLEVIGIDCCVGMALYTGKISLEDAMKTNEVDFEKCKGIVPVIVQEINSGEVLMLAYANKEAVKKTIELGKATYWSRSRQRLWTKGETSGNFQGVKEIWYDCDKDALLYKVKQKGPTCHTNNSKCFYRRLL